MLEISLINKNKTEFVPPSIINLSKQTISQMATGSISSLEKSHNCFEYLWEKIVRIWQFFSSCVQSICCCFNSKENNVTQSSLEELSKIAFKATRLLNISDSSEEKNVAFEIMTRALYQKIPIVLPKEEILVTGIIAPGFGDLDLTLGIIEELKERYPELKIRYICCLWSTDKRAEEIQSRLSECKQCESELMMITDDEEAKFFQRLPSFPFIFGFVQDLIQSSDLTEKLGTKYQFIPEYDTAHRKSGAPGFGIGKEGILIRKNQKIAPLHTIENEQIKKIFFGTDSPSEVEAKQYLTNHAFYFAYLSQNLVDQLLFLYSSLCLESKNSQDIDVVMPFVQEKFLDQNYLREKGIGTLIIHQKNETQILFASTAGKTLRIINDFPFSNTDFQILSKWSRSYKGCTGDQSFSRIISSSEKVLPYYEKIQHKWNVAKAYLELVKEEYSERSLLYQFYDRSIQLDSTLSSYQRGTDNKYSFEKNTEFFFQKIDLQILKVAEEIGVLLEEPLIYEQATQLHAKIRKELSFNSVPSDMLHRYCVLKQFPKLKAIEDALRQDFLEKRKTAEEVFLQMQQKIQEISGQ